MKLSCEEKAELWFLIVLHSLENFLIVFASRLVYNQESYPRLFLIVDCTLVTANILAVLVSVLYVTKLELYAGLPRDLPSSLPSYGLEVSFKCALNPCFHFFFLNSNFLSYILFPSSLFQQFHCCCCSECLPSGDTDSSKGRSQPEPE